MKIAGANVRNNLSLSFHVIVCFCAYEIATASTVFVGGTLNIQVLALRCPLVCGMILTSTG